ncbi:MAG TPA: hypothetical protein VL326_09770 [Kofleriaceae bacterium]|nr:hypothetical protein [Kofleriaceae bacterium]
MPATSPLAFLQPTARTILTATPLGGGLPPGTTVGCWKLKSGGHRLGTRTRHAAIHVETCRQAVVEVFDAPSLLVGSYTSCLHTAVAQAMRVTHCGVPTFYDWGTLVDGRPYVVREAIDGCTLQELGAQEPRVVIEIIRGICDVVVAAHAAGVEHGRLDLDQVLVRERDGVTVLLDWRFADVIADEALRRAQVTSSATRRVPHAHSEAADVFDIGVIMLQLLGDDMPKPLESLVLAMCSDEAHERPTLALVRGRLAAAEDAIARGTDPVAAHVGIMHADIPCASIARTPAADAVAAVSAIELSQPRLPAFRIAGLLSRRWRLSSLALACAAPIAITVWQDHHPTANAQPSTMVAATTITEPLQPRVDPIPTSPAAATPVVATPTPVVAPVAAKPIVPKRVVEKTVVGKEKPTREEPVSHDGIFLRQYQRVGHDLIELEQKLGPSTVAELRAAFREIRINEAAMSTSARQDATLALTDLERRIERMQPIAITDDCKNNPLADGCH